MTGVHRDTILRLLVRVGQRCDEIMADNLRDVPSRYIQADEIWTFVGKKEKRLDGPEAERGDQYVFVALDAETKLVPAFMVGKRDAGTTVEFMALLASRLDGRSVQITTDAFKPYRDAIDFAFGTSAHYAMETKNFMGLEAGRGRYAPPRVSGVVKTEIFGNPEPEHISTAYVERQNWTMRTSMRRLTRLSNGFSRKLANLHAAVSLHFAAYNFCKIHRMLRTTPAMAAGVSARVWSLGELLA